MTGALNEYFQKFLEKRELKEKLVQNTLVFWYKNTL